METNALFVITAIIAATDHSPLNVVGYINLNCGPGYSLLTLPLQSSDPTSSINSVLTNTSPVIPFGAYVYPWDPVHQELAPAIYAGGDGNWYDDDFLFPSTTPLPPGAGFFLYLPTTADGGYANVEITCVGTVLQGTNSISIPNGFGLYGDFEPIQGDLTTNGFPIDATGSYLYRWNYAQQKFYTAVYGVDAADNAPSPEQFYNEYFTQVVVVAPAVGEGFMYYNFGASTQWTQNFEVQ